MFLLPGEQSCAAQPHRSWNGREYGYEVITHVYIHHWRECKQYLKIWFYLQPFLCRVKQVLPSYSNFPAVMDNIVFERENSIECFFPFPG